MVKSQKGSALVIPHPPQPPTPAFLMFLELWKGRGEPLVGKEKGHTIERASRNCRISGNNVEQNRVVI